MQNLDRIAFLDFEASSLSSNSWPIEVGWAVVDQNCRIQSNSALIQPHPQWPLDDWDPKSAAIHKIELASLHQHGVSPREAYTKLTDGLRRRLVYSDAPQHDQHWLMRLQDAAGAHDALPSIMPVGLLFQSTFLDEVLFDRKYRKLIKGRTHRAESDAMGWAQLYVDCYYKLNSCR